MRIKKTHWKQQVNQNEAGIRNCMKPSPSIRLGIKVDDCDYQTIKYLVLIYKHGYQENQNTHFLHIIRALNFWNFSNNRLKTIRSLPVLSWNLGVLWKLLKYLEPVVLWTWFFSNTRTQWFFDSEIFRIPGTSGSLVINFFSNTQEWQVLQNADTHPRLKWMWLENWLIPG